VGAGAAAFASLLAVAACMPASARGRSGARRAPRAVAARLARAPVKAPAPAAPRAPTGSPLVSGSGSASATSEASEAGGAQPGEVDPLVGNGLGSPLCHGVLGEGELAHANRRDCETSGFVAAPAPTGDYGIDVHIDTGVFGVNVRSLVQDLFVQPLWMAIVWAVHALVVMLEWGFTIDLLDSAGVRESVGAGLRRMQLAVTVPWLALALSCASVLAAYNGLIRRRVGETLGQAVALVAMIAVGTWVTLDPTGTVGAVGGWANQASIGTLATAARGAPTGAGDALASSMSDVFAAAVEMPWCYLEFGDVRWCRDPARLDPELRAAALRIAGEEVAQAGCGRAGGSADSCSAGSARARGLAHSAQLLREAQTNGAIFLALPANGPARNSINDPGSLLHVMCRSSDATACRGPMAAAAEFRTDGGTWPRVGGLLLIAAGLAGMLLMLGFIAARLLAAALFSLLYLLMAPAAVLAPAFGERGRQLFGRWAAQLFAAVVSKLLFSFLLGVLLAVVAALSVLGGLGFWTQWLLTSVFWWGAFARREHILALVGGGRPLGRRGGRSPLARRLRPRMGVRDGALTRAKRVLKRLAGPAPSYEHRKQITVAARERARAGTLEQAERSLEHDDRGVRSAEDAAPAVRARSAALHAQLERVRVARAEAVARGDGRRGAELGHRAERVEREIEAQRRRASDAARGARGSDALAERARFLDAQAALPAVGGPLDAGRTDRRDYAALAGLAGYTRGEYDALGSQRQRAARLEIDRELALRREMHGAVRDVARDAEMRGVDRRRRRYADAAFERTLAERMRASGRRMPASAGDRSPIGRWRASGRRADADSLAARSRVMEDARAVAERRKRQLGFGRD
jgi:hypothetical protein